jgi:hypothetical protein
MRYSASQHDAFPRDFNRDSLVMLPGHFPPALFLRLD